MADLKEVFQSKIQPFADEVARIQREHGEFKISECTVAQAYGGMRGVKCMTYETSALDPLEGIRFRGRTIPDLIETLPRAPGGEQPLPEGLFYLLLTGDMPTEEDARAVGAEWRRREGLPPQVARALDALPRDAHPMTQYSLGLLAMQTESAMAAAYHKGIAKRDLWRPMYDDVMNILANAPLVAAYVYRRAYHGGRHVEPGPKDWDWARNFAHMLGYDQPQFADLMRLYLSIHSDHEGGNVSAHTVRLVGSALSDCYYALSAGMNGLAGPLHGLASQESIRWILELQKSIGKARPTRDDIANYIWETLGAGRVVPGFGHAVLRRTDPRYMALREFALKHMADDDVFYIVATLFEVAPPILESQAKIKNPWPNVDAHSGAVLLHYGMTELDFFTVLFGVSRATGTMASLLWDRALNLPLERPKSVTTGWVREQVYNL